MGARRRAEATATAVALLLGGATVGPAAAGKTTRVTYKAKISKTDRVIVVITGGTRATFTLICGRQNSKIENVRIKRKRFSGARNEATAKRNPVLTVNGTVRGSVVTGAYTTTKCKRKSASWRARRA